MPRRGPWPASKVQSFNAPGRHDLLIGAPPRPWTKLTSGSRIIGGRATTGGPGRRRPSHRDNGGHASLTLVDGRVVLFARDRAPRPVDARMRLVAASAPALPG